MEHPLYQYNAVSESVLSYNFFHQVMLLTLAVKFPRLSIYTDYNIMMLKHDPSHYKTLLYLNHGLVVGLSQRFTSKHYSLSFVFPSTIILNISLTHSLPTGHIGLGIGSWASNRGIESQGNPIILRDLTQECRKNI